MKQNPHSLLSPGCCGLFCEPCLVYKNAEGLQKSGILYCLLGCFMPCIPALLLRNEARSQYNIQVSSDCVLRKVRKEKRK